MARVVDDVVFHKNSTAALVQIDAASAACGCVHIMNDVVTDDGARRNAKRIYAGEIAQDALADFENVVVLNAIVMCEAGTVAPCPADGNRRVVEIGDSV